MSMEENQKKAEENRKLFVGGLSRNTTNETFRDFYSKFGTVLESTVVMDNVTNLSRCFGFITFSSKEEVDVAMSNRPHEIDGKVVDPKRAGSKNQPNVSTKSLYVKGVSEDHTEEQFRDYFSKFGNIEKVNFITDKVTGMRRDFAFVVFEDHDSVSNCVLTKIHTINGKQCQVSKGLSSKEKEAAAQIRMRNMKRHFQSFDGGFGNNFGQPWSSNQTGYNGQMQGYGGPMSGTNVYPPSPWNNGLNLQGQNQVQTQAQWDANGGDQYGQQQTYLGYGAPNNVGSWEAPQQYDIQPKKPKRSDQN